MDEKRSYSAADLLSYLDANRKWLIPAGVATVLCCCFCFWASVELRKLDRRITARLSALKSQRVMILCRQGRDAAPFLPLDGAQHRSWLRLDEIPPHVQAAVIAIEDHRFYRHHGIDFVRSTKAVLDAIRTGRTPRGTSTITQQVARLLFLTRVRSFGRKANEALISTYLEYRLRKPEILEIYLNLAPLGRVGPYPIRGLQEAAFAYFGKDVKQLDVSEAAMLAGMIQRPAYLSPRSHPERAITRRNMVLQAMSKYGLLSVSNRESATKSAPRLISSDESVAWAGHYYQLAEKELERLGASDGDGLRIELTLDPELQRIASDAVRRGGERLDRILKIKSGEARPEIALVALDPSTGAVRALAGGRDYVASQLNRAVAQRQPGSAFKPFVYAAALEYGVPRGPIGPDSLIQDSPHQFNFGGQIYSPANFHGFSEEFVTLQDALNRSLNVPAVRLAEAVGYGRVAALAARAGFDNVRATPSMALGSYETSPLSLAAAYSVFANRGMLMKPYFIERVSSLDGETLDQASPVGVSVLRPNTSLEITQMLTRVMSWGTGAGVRRLGFYVPAAGKTGTSDDGWFAAFTTRLICVVWVGYDDNRELHLEGAKSALPIWTEFMMKAHQLQSYKNATAFAIPAARNSVAVDIDEPAIDAGMMTPASDSSH